MTRSLSKPWRAFGVVALLLAAALACSEPAPQPDVDQIRAADQAYATAWLSNDPEQVMSTLTDDVVLTPSGLPTLRGAEAARGFWWPPDSPATTVTGFDLDPRLVAGNDDEGLVRGTFVLEFDYDGETFSSGGSYTSRLRRDENGAWRIYERSWVDRN